jgi:hypothetical protein
MNTDNTMYRLAVGVALAAALLNGFFVALFVGSAWLFLRAAQ